MISNSLKDLWEWRYIPSFKKSHKTKKSNLVNRCLKYVAINISIWYNEFGRVEVEARKILQIKSGKIYQVLNKSITCISWVLIIQ